MPQVCTPSTTEDEDNAADSLTPQGTDDTIRLWKEQELISLHDDDGDAFAHDVLIDGEPEPDNNDLVDAEHVQARLWVKITSVVTAKISLPKDCCFDFDGNEVQANSLKPSKTGAVCDRAQARTEGKQTVFDAHGQQEQDRAAAEEEG